MGFSGRATIMITIACRQRRRRAKVIWDDLNHGFASKCRGEDNSIYWEIRDIMTCLKYCWNR